MLPACQFLTILTSESLSRAGVVQILSTSWAADPSQLPFFGPTFANLRSDKTMEKHSISRNSYPPKRLCCENIDAAIATGNFQYSRKLELLNFLWSFVTFAKTLYAKSATSKSNSWFNSCIVSLKKWSLQRHGGESRRKPCPWRGP